MTFIAKVLRSFAKLKFRALKLATIKDIPTEEFNRIAKHFISEGWTKKYVYDGFDAWIDYGKIILKKGSSTLIIRMGQLERGKH